jgi:hypothetical protein
MEKSHIGAWSSIPEVRMADLDKQDQMIIGIAALFAALVRAQGEQDKSVPVNFARYAKELCLTFSEEEDAPLKAMEMLTWACTFLGESSVR